VIGKKIHLFSRDLISQLFLFEHIHGY